MSGYFTNERQQLKFYQTLLASGPADHWLYGAPSFQGLRDQYVSCPPLKQRTYSFRTGGEYSRNPIDPHSLLSENHRKNVRPYDTGHEFSSVKTDEFLSHPDWVAYSGQGHYVRGPIKLGGFNTADYNRSFGKPDLNKGTFALKQTRPTKSAANLSQLVLELLVDLPTIPYKPFMKGWNKDPLRKISGSEYLNIVFGWQPTVTDVLKICEAIVRSNEILTQYERDSGKNVRRQFAFAPESTTISTNETARAHLSGMHSYNSYSALYAGLPTSARTGKQVLTRVHYESYWFKGAWTYHYENPVKDSVFDFASAAQLARKLLGFQGLTPELLWELAPWSWLIDWFINIGDLLELNVALGQDDLVLRYGYLMRTTRIQATAAHDGVTQLSGPTGPITQSVQITAKERFRSTPYGFGVNMDSLNANQWAILAALGMTGGDKKLVWG